MLLTAHRKRFLNNVAQQVGAQDVKCVVLTHLLPDRPEFLEALDRVAKVKLVVGIEYSVDIRAKNEITANFNVKVPPFGDLFSADRLLEMLRYYVDESRFVILEIGGYFAPHLDTLQSTFGERLLGLIEDTEGGHRRYESVPAIPYPVVSVARSPMKEAEDALVGPSCLFSAERILRDQGILMSGREVAVLGYGKVGRGTAQALRARGSVVAVYDTNISRAATALAEGFRIPSREIALKSASMIFGCTGLTSVSREDFGILRSGCFLVSCSSKCVEFDIGALASEYVLTKVAPNLGRYDRESRRLFLMHGGAPVNFVDKAVVGPVLSMVQAEMLYAIRELGEDRNVGIKSVREEYRDALGKLWLAEFIDPRTGCYKQ